MRFFVAGLVLVALSIGASEYTRRHPSEAKKESAAKGAKRVPNPTAPPSMKALVETTSPANEAPVSPTTFEQRLNEWSTTTTSNMPGFSTILRGKAKARELKGFSDGALIVFENDAEYALVRLSRSEAPKVLAVRRTPIASIAVDEGARRVVWSEGGAIWVVPLRGGAIEPLVAFERALVTSVAATGNRMVATLVPKEGDSFSSEPNGAVVAIEGKNVTLIATEQIRPRDVVFDGKQDAFFIAGYPSGLTRAALDGSFTAKIAERADGPIALEPEGVVYRSPLQSAPELRRTARAGGAPSTIARVDAEWLAVHDGIARYTTTGFSPRLYEAAPGNEPVELVAIDGVAKGLAWSGESLWLLTADDTGTFTVASTAPSK
jgi:hypothetical protein